MEHTAKVLTSYEEQLNNAASILPAPAENICFFDTDISFQCSDGFDNAILCGAYDNLDAELRFTDWHNF